MKQLANLAVGSAMFALSLAGAQCSQAKTQREPKGEQIQSPAEEPSEKEVPPQLTVELDIVSGLVAGEQVAGEVLELVRKSFREVGVEVLFIVQRVKQPAEPLVTDASKSELLRSSRDNPKALHVVVAARGAGAHAIVHYRRTRSLDQTGVLVYADTVADEFQENPLLGAAGLTLDQLIARSLAHEIGHAIGCGHDDRIGSASVMVQNSTLGRVIEDNMGRWRLALAGTSGYPQFDDSFRACLDLSSVLSVDTLRPRYSETNKVPSADGRTGE